LPAKPKATGYALIASAACGWGLWPLVLRHAVMPAAMQAAIMMTVLTLVSGPIMLRDRFAAKATRSDWLLVGWLGVSDALNTILFFAAYQRTSVAIAVLTHYLTPIFIALAAPFVVHEKLGPRTKVAVAISFAGLFLLLAPWRDGISSNDALGAALGAGSAVFYASNVLTNKRIAQVFSGSEMMFFHGLVGTPVLWALVPREAFRDTETSSLLVVLAGSLALGSFGGLAFSWGLKRIKASHASVLTLLEPFVAVVTAAVFLAQSVGVASILGGFLILGGAGLVVVQSEST
jgi:drug/metabolite transporter (DMT)-like permease